MAARAIRQKTAADLPEQPSSTGIREAGCVPRIATTTPYARPVAAPVLIRVHRCRLRSRERRLQLDPVEMPTALRHAVQPALATALVTWSATCRDVDPTRNCGRHNPPHRLDTRQLPRRRGAHASHDRQADPPASLATRRDRAHPRITTAGGPERLQMEVGPGPAPVAATLEHPERRSSRSGRASDQGRVRLVRAQPRHALTSVLLRASPASRRAEQPVAMKMQSLVR